MTQTDRPAESPTLSRELSVFLIQLSVGIHKYGTYPKGHPVIEHAAGAAYQGIVDLLAERGGLALGVARDQLLIDGVGTDPGNPLLRELASRLHRHQISVIRFRPGVMPDEMLDFLETVSAEANRQEMPFGLRPADELDRWRNIEVVPFSFENLEIGEAGDGTQASARSAQLWFGLASAALRKGRADDTIEEGAHQIAGAINTRHGDKAYDQIIVGYLQELGRELRRRDGETYGQLQTRVTQLLSSLDKETMNRLLSVGGDLAGRRALVSDFASSLPVKAVLELVQAAAAAEKRTISHSLLRMLTKLADHADQGKTTVRARADEGFRVAIKDLLSDWTLADPNPDNYTQVLDQLALPADAPGAGTPTDEDHIQEAPRILQMALEIDVTGEAVFHALAMLVKTGQLEELVQVLDAAPEGSAAAGAIWKRLATPAMMSGVLAVGEANIDVVERILDKIGGAAIEPMLDALSTTDSRGMRHRLLNALTALGTVVGPPAAKRLVGAEWFVQRNLLIVLGALPEWPADFDPLPYAGGSDPRVRREALKLMIQGGQRPELRDLGVQLSLGDIDDANLRMGLAAALEKCPPAVEPLLTACMDNDNEEIRVLAIRVLGGLRSIRARELLLAQVMARKVWWRRARLAQPTPEMLAALRGLAVTWARHPEAQAVMALAARNANRDVRMAAGISS